MDCRLIVYVCLCTCLLQSEARGERSASESPTNGVWQGEMLHVNTRHILYLWLQLVINLEEHSVDVLLV